MDKNESSAIEISYPHVAKGLCEYWRKPECIDYLESLVFDNEAVDRDSRPMCQPNCCFSTI